jgi:hypothetical protein
MLVAQLAFGIMQPSNKQKTETHQEGIVHLALTK